MANFCPECGKKINHTDKYCKECGAALIESANQVRKKESEFEKPSIPVPVPSKPSGPAWSYVVTNILGVIIGLGIIVLVLYSLGCAMGMFPDTEDRMCQSIYHALSGEGGTSGSGGSKVSGGGSQVSIGCQHCSPGSCWTGTTCCPTSAQFYCNGKCYRSSGDAYSAGCHQSSWTRWCCT